MYITNKTAKLLHKLIFVYPELEHCIFTNGSYIDISPPTLRLVVDVISVLRNNGKYNGSGYRPCQLTGEAHNYVSFVVDKDTYTINVLTLLGSSDIKATTQITLKDINENITN